MLDILSLAIQKNLWVMYVLHSLTNHINYKWYTCNTTIHINN